MIREQKQILNVVFSSDDNYAQHLGVVIYSLLKQNLWFEKINIFVIDNDISPQNRQKLLEVIEDFSYAGITWFDFNEWKKKLNLNMMWEISISTYARIFIGSMLPKEIEKVLYLDCDMIVCQDLEELWKVDLNKAVIGAVQDTISDSTKKAVGKDITQPYFNAGMLLIDLKKWRELGIEELCLEFLEKKQGCVVHHDQGILNGVLKGKWFRLPLAYNLMTIHYMFNQEQIQKFFEDHSEFYFKEEVEEAKVAPKILHFTPSLTCRPWVKGCNHPLKNLYWDMLSETPWKDTMPQKNREKIHVRLINWRYRNLPF